MPSPARRSFRIAEKIVRPQQQIVEQYSNRIGMNLKIVEVVGERFFGDLLQSFKKSFGCQLAMLPVVNLPDYVHNEYHEENTNCKLIYQIVQYPNPKRTGRSSHSDLILGMINQREIYPLKQSNFTPRWSKCQFFHTR